MPADISRRHAAEIAEVRHWHAPESKVVVCLRCRVPRTFRKSRWTCGRYHCECCGAHNDERWRGARGVWRRSPGRLRAARR